MRAVRRLSGAHKPRRHVPELCEGSVPRATAPCSSLDDRVQAARRLGVAAPLRGRVLVAVGVELPKGERRTEDAHHGDRCAFNERAADVVKHLAARPERLGRNAPALRAVEAIASEEASKGACGCVEVLGEGFAPEHARASSRASTDLPEQRLDVDDEPLEPLMVGSSIRDDNVAPRAPPREDPEGIGARKGVTEYEVRVEARGPVVLARQSNGALSARCHVAELEARVAPPPTAGAKAAQCVQSHSALVRRPRGRLGCHERRSSTWAPRVRGHKRCHLQKFLIAQRVSKV